MKEVGRALWGQTDLFLSSLWKSLEGAEGRHPAGAGLDEALWRHGHEGLPERGSSLSKWHFPASF